MGKITLRNSLPDDPIFKEGLRMYSVRLGKSGQNGHSSPPPAPEKSPDDVRKISRESPRD